ncbi:MAG: PilZ domain-containing protein [Reinekea sp.]|jgi:cyclic-di-GMP-binding protein
MSIASLKLTMPKQNLHVNKETVALYSDVLGTQVLNVTEFENHYDKIVTNLHNLNRMPLNGDDRFNITEALINQYILFMQHVRCGDMQLTVGQAKDLPELNREFSYATKLLLRDTVSHSKEETANFVYWAISAMCEQLQDYSNQHRQQPEALWMEINRLYEYSETHFLTDFHSNKPDYRDIESRFKQALLFQAAQPEHLNQTELQLIDSYLRKWAFRAHLNHQESREFNSHYFYVDLESNLGAQSSRQIKGAGNDNCIRALNPLPVIEQARQHMNQLRNGTAADKIGFGQSADNIDSFMCLKKALLAWKQSSSRRFERAPCAIEARTALGLNTIHKYLRTPAAVAESMIGSQTINISKTGACVKIDHCWETKDLSVGDVVIHHQEYESSGKLAIIRWLKRVGESVMFGVEFMVGNLQPVTIHVKDKISEALLISTSDNDSLITHKGYCASNTPVRLKSSKHGIALDARAQSLMQRGTHVDQIRLKRSQTA